MMYKLINENTGKEYICDKVTIEGYDYYHIQENGIYNDNGFNIFKSDNKILTNLVSSNIKVKTPGKYYKVIATTNPNISVFNVVNDKQYTKEDMIEFHIFAEEAEPICVADGKQYLCYCTHERHCQYKYYYSNIELFDKWLEQRTETLYFQ